MSRQRVYQARGAGKQRRDHEAVAAVGGVFALQIHVRDFAVEAGAASALFGDARRRSRQSAARSSTSRHDGTYSAGCAAPSSMSLPIARSTASASGGCARPRKDSMGPRRGLGRRVSSRMSPRRQGPDGDFRCHRCLLEPTGRSGIARPARWVMPGRGDAMITRAGAQGMGQAEHVKRFARAGGVGAPPSAESKLGRNGGPGCR